MLELGGTWMSSGSPLASIRSSASASVWPSVSTVRVQRRDPRTLPTTTGRDRPTISNTPDLDCRPIADTSNTLGSGRLRYGRAIDLSHGPSSIGVIDAGAEITTLS